MEPTSAKRAEAASLLVVDPNGSRTRVAIDALPFRIGRSPENQLILRDSRISRTHAEVCVEDGGYVLRDCGSSHGVYVNGERVERRALRDSDRVDFGVQDSYSLVFTLDSAELQRLMEHAGAAGAAPGGPLPGVGGNLAKLRAILDLARTMQSSLSIDDVLASVVDAALAVTGAERGFLLLRAGERLETRVARRKDGRPLGDSDLRVPRDVLRQALERRRELFHMNFSPGGAGEAQASRSVVDLELRSVVCVPLVRMRTGQGDETSMLSAAGETAGVLYLDSRASAADLAHGNRELIQTLAIEASTVLENARLLEEERAKQRLAEELNLARSIQQSLLPRALPADGWLRAAGSNMASRLVSGDYYDVEAAGGHAWWAVVADVSGKGVGSALLAALLQGALITATESAGELGRRMEGLNRFLMERTGGEKYATVFYGLVTREGLLQYVNAAHCPPLVARTAGELTDLEATGMPVGLVEGAEYEVREARLNPGDRLVIYTDGVTEAQNAKGEFFGKQRLRETVAAHAGGSCQQLHDSIQGAVALFTEGAEQADDITVLVVEYGG
ncbi:MAG TPA: SpoIIE family protein phosphatase [Bryobacteraceae bacterium]|nr:SpoIIE family protein phosphatase [Bryobacteraceae bacterium]